MKQMFTHKPPAKIQPSDPKIPFQVPGTFAGIFQVPGTFAGILSENTDNFFTMCARSGRGAGSMTRHLPVLNGLHRPKQHQHIQSKTVTDKEQQGQLCRDEEYHGATEPESYSEQIAGNG